MKLTLGKYRGADTSLKNLYVRPVTLKSGPHLTFLWRHATRDITKNLPPADALAQLDALLGADFLDAHLFTTTTTAQLECQPDGNARLKTGVVESSPSSAPVAHDQPKHHLVPADAPWLRALGVTNDRGQPREGMAPKYRQIQKFTELLSHLVTDAPLPTDRPWQIADMGCGKGYLTFAVATLFGARATVTGIERRPDLVDLCNRIARETQTLNLTFQAGDIANSEIENLSAVGQAKADRESKIENAPSEALAKEGSPDLLIALHACDTATDDALAHGLRAQAALLVVSPCCQKELRPQLTAPPVLADALRHGIFQERQAEFVTDALRAQLLEWAGYRTKVFEFISTEHTAKNLLIAATRAHAPADPARAARIRAFAAFYGIRHHRLATLLDFPLSP